MFCHKELYWNFLIAFSKYFSVQIPKTFRDVRCSSPVIPIPVTNEPFVSSRIVFIVFRLIYIIKNNDLRAYVVLHKGA